jgi:CMP-N-acetylneuraminic acid synthetase
MCPNERGELKAVFEKQMTSRSQDLPELFCPTGAIWWARTDVLRRTKTFHLENRTGWEIPWQRGIDIDTFEDWAMAEVLFRLPQFRSECDQSICSTGSLEPGL